MNRTKIEYLDFTWNPIVGCSGIGCAVREHCWARAAAKRQRKRCVLCYHFAPHLHRERLFEPMQRNKPAFIGVCFMGDLFDKLYYDYDRSTIQAVLDSIEKTYWHTFFCLTKQPQNVFIRKFPDNFWLGVSVNRREDAWRIEKLVKTSAKVKAVSFEPLYEDMKGVDLKGVDWVIIGAQTRPHLLPEYEWIQNLTVQAKTLGIPVFCKNNLAPLIEPKTCQEYPSVKD